MGTSEKTPSQTPPAPSQSDHSPKDERRRSNLVRNEQGRIVKNDRKQKAISDMTFDERNEYITKLVNENGYYNTSGIL